MLGFRFRVSGGVLVCVRCSFPVFNHIIQKELSLCIVRQTWPRVPQWCLSQARGKTKVKLHVREMRLPSRRSFTFAATATERTPLLDHMRVCVHPPVKCVFLGTQILTKKF